jgi:hypothetical protein
VVGRRHRRGPLLWCLVLFLAEVVEVEVARGVEDRSTWLCCVVWVAYCGRVGVVCRAMEGATVGTGFVLHVKMGA